MCLLDYMRLLHWDPFPKRIVAKLQTIKKCLLPVPQRCKDVIRGCLAGTVLYMKAIILCHCTIKIFISSQIK